MILLILLIISLAMSLWLLAAAFISARADGRYPGLVRDVIAPGRARPPGAPSKPKPERMASYSPVHLN